MPEIKTIEVYTDGSCLKNPGPGGWAFVGLEQSKRRQIRGGDINSTNNRMELTAVIKAINYYKNKYDKIIIYSDSLLTINCAKKLWKRNKNKDLWIKYDDSSKGQLIVFKKVKAHDGNFYNEIVDRLAKKACIETK